MGRGQQEVAVAASRRDNSPRQHTLRPKGIFWGTAPSFRFEDGEVSYPREVPNQNPTALSFPSNSLVIVAGMPGSGKSTFLEKLLPEVPTLSIDGLQRELRRRWKKKVTLGAAADRVPKRLSEMMEEDGPVALEITGMRRKHRRLFQHLAFKAGRPCHIIFLDTDPDVCRERQHERGHVIDEDKMSQYAGGWLEIKSKLCEEHDEVAVESVQLEDYASVSVLGLEAVDVLRAVRFRV